MVALMMLFINFFTASRMPLQRRDWFIFRNIMSTDPIFNCILWGGNPGNSSEFKNSVGYQTSSWLVTESIDLNVINSPAILFWIWKYFCSQWSSLLTIHDFCNFEQCLRKPSRWLGLCFSKVTKLEGNMMYPDDESTGIFSFCNSTYMFIFNLSVLTSFHKMDDCKHALGSSAGVDHGVTGSIWRKSHAHKIIAPPNRFLFFRKSCNMPSNASKDVLCAIVHSS